MNYKIIINKANTINLKQKNYQKIIKSKMEEEYSFRAEKKLSLKILLKSRKKNEHMRKKNGKKKKKKRKVHVLALHHSQ